MNHHDGVRTYTHETGWVQADPTQPLKELEPEEKQKPYVRKVTASRNGKCPCGSDKKFKKCCIKTV